MGWELAYSHDENGNRTGGNIDRLIKAVLSGLPVRVVRSHPKMDYIYVTDAQNLWVRNKIVYGQNISHVSCEFKGDVLKFKDDSYWYMILFSTKGDTDVIRWSVGEHTPRGRSTYKIAVKWFVQTDRRRPFPKEQENKNQ